MDNNHRWCVQSRTSDNFFPFDTEAQARKALETRPEWNQGLWEVAFRNTEKPPPSKPLLPTYAKREYISYSTLMSFIRCPRKYFYSKSGIASHEEPTALLYGTAMHAAIGVATVEGFEAAFAAFAAVWDDAYADSKRSLKRAHDQLKHFCHTHDGLRSIYTMLPPPPSTVELSKDTSPFEITFVLDVGLPVPIAGRMDGWCQHRDTGDYWAYEFKSTSRLTASMFDSLELNPQVLCYALVCRTLTQRPICGVMFEAMLIDPKKVDNITHPVPVSDHHLDDTVVWLRYWGEQLLACEQRALELNDPLASHDVEHPMYRDQKDPASAFPKNFAGCSAYPLFYQTGSSCEYLNLCRPADWRTMLPYYQIKPEHRLIDLTQDGKAVRV